MDFLMNFFEKRVNKIGTIEDQEKMAKVISKWNSLKTHTLKEGYRDWETDRKSTRLNSSHSAKSRMPSSA